MTYARGDCFTLTPEAVEIYERHPGTIYSVKAGANGKYIADGLLVACYEHEMQPHPGPPSAERVHKRRRRAAIDLRTPMQLFQADIYASIIRHRINAMQAITVLLDAAEAIEAGTNEQATAEAVRKTIRSPSARELAARIVDAATRTPGA